MTDEKINAVIREKTTSFLAGHPNPTMVEVRGFVAELTDGLFAELPELAPQVKVVGCDPAARTVTAEIFGVPKDIVLNLKEGEDAQ